MPSDLVIIGAGPAGLSAAANGAAEGLRVAALESTRFGGQAGTSSRIENYLGFPDGLSGADLTRRAVAQATRLGAALHSGQRVTALERDGARWRVECASGASFIAPAVLLATGARWRELDIPGAAGPNVHYAAPREVLHGYAGAPVAIIGAANSAGQAALELARIGCAVTVIARRTLADGASRYLVDRIAGHPRVTVLEHARPGAILPDGVALEDGRLVPAAGVFPYIGAVPAADFLPDDVARDARGYVLTAPGSYASSAPGLFVAGDARAASRKRVATAAGEGATATAEVFDYVQTIRKESVQ
jgi:thioredoxin reductase (NADPH)